MLNIMRDVGGVQMPEFFGKIVTEPEKQKPAEPTPPAEPERGA
jgi:hypothetical protein